MAIPASSGFRVIYHAPICPTCGSSNITTDDIETTDGLTEEAFICLACGETWPLACVTDWDTQAGDPCAPPGIRAPAGGTS
jgi:hypothetical protein